MPETDTLPTDRTPDPEAPQAPQGPAPGSFQNLSEQLYGSSGAVDAWKRSAAKVREGLERKSEATEPLIAAAETELKAPRPTPPAPPNLPAPPSRQLTEFLAPVEGESPTTSITKLLQAVGLFATGISGAARGDARAGLAAFTGAMKGWQEGDIIRADRHFADWEAKTGTALTKWKTERQTYQDIMEAANLTLDQRFKLVELAALRENNKMLADVAEKKDLETLVTFLGQRETHADTVQTNMLRIVSAKQDKDADRAMRERLAEMGRETQMAMATMADQTRRDIAAQASGERAERAKDRAEGKPTPAGELKNIQDVAFSQGIVNELSRLAKSPNVRLEKVMGGIRPWLNDIIQTGKIGGVPVDPKTFGTLSPDEQRLISLTNDYADVILRIRSGAAITDSEFKRMLGFLASPAVTPEVFVERLGLQTDLLNAKKATIRATLAAGGYKAPDIQPPSLAPPTTGEAAAPPIPGVGSPPRAGMVLVRRKSDGAMGWLEPGNLGDKYTKVR